MRVRLALKRPCRRCELPGELTNRVAPDRTPRRLLLMLGMGAFLVCALAIPQAFDDGGIAFGLGYLAVVLVHSALYAEVFGAAVVVRFAPLNAVSAGCVIAAGFFEDAPAYALWS